MAADSFFYQIDLALGPSLYLRGHLTAEEAAAGDPFILALLLGRPGEARQLLEVSLSMDSPPPLSRSPRSKVFEAFSILGRPEEAIEFSRSHLARIGKPMGNLGAFFETVDRYMRGEASAEALLGAADRDWARRRCRIHAHFLIGLERLSRSDREGAVRHFEEIELAGSYFFYSRPWTAVLLQRLREDPQWPPWIPVEEQADTVGK